MNPIRDISKRMLLIQLLAIISSMLLIYAFVSIANAVMSELPYNSYALFFKSHKISFLAASLGILGFLLYFYTLRFMRCPSCGRLMGTLYSGIKNSNFTYECRACNVTWDTGIADDGW